MRLASNGRNWRHVEPHVEGGTRKTCRSAQAEGREWSANEWEAVGAPRGRGRQRSRARVGQRDFAEPARRPVYDKYGRDTNIIGHNQPYPLPEHVGGGVEHEVGQRYLQPVKFTKGHFLDSYGRPVDSGNSDQQHAQSVDGANKAKAPGIIPEIEKTDRTWIRPQAGEQQAGREAKGAEWTDQHTDAQAEATEEDYWDPGWLSFRAQIRFVDELDQRWQRTSRASKERRRTRTAGTATNAAKRAKRRSSSARGSRRPPAEAI